MAPLLVISDIADASQKQLQSHPLDFFNSINRQINLHSGATLASEEALEQQTGIQPKQKRSDDRRVASRVAPSAALMVVIGAAGVYSGIRGALQGYQHFRRRMLRQLIAHVCPVLDELGVVHWADFGTLLGMYREKDVILHDNDADIVLLSPDWDLLAAKLQGRLPSHLKVYFVSPSEDPSIRWLRVSCGGVGIMDLYGAYDTGDVNLEIPQGHGELCDLPRKLVLPLTRLHFRGYDVSVPGNVVGVLKFRYGETFMTPRYMDKGRDSVEQGKLYARLLGLLGRTGLWV